MSKVRRRRRVGTGKVKIRMSGFRIVVDVWMSGFSMRKELLGGGGGVVRGRTGMIERYWRDVET